jgi:uncharacterized protein YhfF
MDKSLTQMLAQIGIDTDPEGVILSRYGDSPALSCDLIELIRQGRKRATSSLLWSYEHDGEPLVSAGMHELVVAWDGIPELLTKIVQVDIRPFTQVSEVHAMLEGEGDLSLAYWRDVHWAFFTRECRRIARDPSPDMAIVCVQFELLRDLRVVGCPAN